MFGFQTDPSETLCCLATLCKRGVLFVTFFVLDWSQLLCCLSMVFVSAFSSVFFLVKIILNMYRPECVCYTRKAEFRVNRLRTGVSRFAANMVLMGRCGSGLRECGKVHTAHRILHVCTESQPPCHISEVDNPVILECFTQSKFWPTCIPAHVYERRSLWSDVQNHSFVWLRWNLFFGTWSHEFCHPSFLTKTTVVP